MYKFYMYIYICKYKDINTRTNVYGSLCIHVRGGNL